MLVIKRNLLETVELPELGVKFVILDIKGKRVKVGVAAPHEYRIWRGVHVDEELKDVPTT